MELNILGIMIYINSDAYQDKILSKKLVNRLLKFKDEKWRWVGFHDKFNSWEIPVEFYDLIPKWWNKNSYIDRKHIVITDVFNLIKNEIGNKEILRAHNCERGMTHAEFEYWYELNKKEFYSREVHVYYERREEFEKIEFWKDHVYNRLIDTGFVLKNTESELENSK